MSLLNQMLNDLEKRGAGIAVGDEAVRAVPRPMDRLIQVLASMLLALGAVLLVFAFWKASHRSSQPAAAPVVQQPVMQQAVSQAAPQSTAAPQLPAFQLSFELSSIPLPHSEPISPQPTKKHVASQRQPAQHKSRSVAAKSKAEPVVDAHNEYVGPPIKHISPQQQAADEYGQALALIRQGRKNEALPHLEATLQLDPGHTLARQALVGLLLESGLNAEAEQVLQRGLHHDPKQPALAMLLARLQVEHGALPDALDTLETTLPFADRQASYHAFVAAVLQRQNRNKEAITHYQIALRLAPDTAVWWMGLGISLQAVDASEDARDAFQHALKLHKLSPQLQAFVEQRLKSLAPKK